MRLALGGLHAAQVDQRDGQLHVLAQDLLGHAVGVGPEHGAQSLVARNQRLEAAAQGRFVQRSFEPQGPCDMVRRALLIELPEEPLAQLRVRGRQREQPLRCTQQRDGGFRRRFG
ncbi:hypothetical protein D3C71_1182570 [compost metagenome]